MTTNSTQPFSKSKLLRLPFVLGLLLATASASPIPHSRLSRRSEQPQDCPGTLRGPSGNAYFAFSSSLNNEVAKEACASCYGGVLASIGYSDLQFLNANLEQPSWIKSWNGDDYSNSCLTIQLYSGAEPGVVVDSACASQNWPLCQATSNIPESFLRIEDGTATLNSLAVAYFPSQVAPLAVTLVPEINTEQTAETVSIGANVDPAAAEVSAAQPQAEQVSVAAAPAVPVPEAVNQVTAPAVVTEQTPWTASVAAVAPAPVAVAPAPIVETSAPIVETPAPVTESAVLLMADKEKVRAAFEENMEACSAQLAYGEQDPIANEYMIEHMAETASCSKARHAAQEARLAKEAAV